MAGKLIYPDFHDKAQKDFGIEAVKYGGRFFGNGKMDGYQGVAEMLPYAKTYDFDVKGEQPNMDHKRLLDLVKTSGFKVYIGIAFEGFTQPEEGI